jgi:hypothetical protein
MTKPKSTARGLVPLLTLVVVALAVPAIAQPRRVDPNARQILDYRLTPDNVRGFDAVMRSMDRAPDRGAEAPRSDLAMISMLTAAWAHADAWRDTTLDEMVRTLDRGHPELIAAIRSAGMSTRDYVLTTMILMLAHPVASDRRQGRGVTATDVAVENVDWVEANWQDVDRLMRDLQHRMDAARRR